MSMEHPNSNLQTVPYFHSLPGPTNIAAAEYEICSIAPNFKGIINSKNSTWKANIYKHLQVRLA